ncbi:MAG: SIR2 family protein [Candidatus Omnitrophica bacterium]|nr:SIR2 family protein [Candidatus Omnitrophota bacterium]
MGDLLIILGAGASFDCVDETKSSIDIEYWPPLTRHIFTWDTMYQPRKQIFATNHFKENLLNKHVLASSVGYELKKDIALEDYLANLGDSQFDSEKRKYIALPFYLKELFSEISNKFLRSKLGNNYARLLNKLVRTRYSKLNFITTNYDTILDATFELLYNHYFKCFDDYLNFSGDGKIFNYLKIHGSVNWSYIVNGSSEIANIDNVIHGKITSVDKVLENIKNSTDLNLDSNIAGVATFPALAAPLGSYKYVNSDQVASFLNQELNIEHILVIGNSGKDNTIFALLNEIIQDKINLFIVGDDDESVVKVADAFRKNLKNKIYPLNDKVNYYLGGFSYFARESSDVWIRRISAA